MEVPRSYLPATKYAKFENEKVGHTQGTFWLKTIWRRRAKNEPLGMTFALDKVHYIVACFE